MPEPVLKKSIFKIFNESNDKKISKQILFFENK